MITTWNCILGPKLYAFHGEEYWEFHDPNSIEELTDFLLMILSAVWFPIILVLPIIAAMIYYRCKDRKNSIKRIFRVVVIIFLFFFLSLVLRTLIRRIDPDYSKFIKTLTKAQDSYNNETKQQIREYDFDFFAWPIDYRVESENTLNGKPRIILSNDLDEDDKTLILSWPRRALSYLLANTIAIKLMYQGSLSWVNMEKHPKCLQGRIDLVELGGRRSKLQTYIKNTIDTVFMDKRNKSKNGNILLITCEDNLGFYEIGMMTSPWMESPWIEEYSVLGWNHPGFGGSTGTPFPDEEIDAIDAVIKYAVEILNFKIDNILLHGQGMGGFTATWAAMNYQDLNGLILDATFDDVLYPAMNTMPVIPESIVRNIVRGYINLNNAEQLKKYNGSVLVVRRTADEIMSTSDGNLENNRANYLLTKLLVHRYPKLFEEDSGSKTLDILRNYLSRPTHDSNGNVTRSLTERTQDLFGERHPLDEILCSFRIEQVIRRDNGEVKYPSTLGDNLDSIMKQHLVVYLANKYMEDQGSGHDSFLKAQHLHLPWRPWNVSPVI